MSTFQGPPAGLSSSARRELDLAKQLKPSRRFLEQEFRPSAALTNLTRILETARSLTTTIGPKSRTNSEDQKTNNGTNNYKPTFQGPCRGTGSTFFAGHRGVPGHRTVSRHFLSDTSFPSWTFLRDLPRDLRRAFAGSPAGAGPNAAGETRARWHGLRACGHGGRL